MNGSATRRTVRDGAVTVSPMQKPRSWRLAGIGLSAALLFASACSSSGHAAGSASSAPSSSSLPTVPTTGADQLPSPFTEGQRAGLPGDLDLRVAAATRSGGKIHIEVEIVNGRTGALALGALAPLFTFRAMFFGSDAPLLSGTATPDPVAAGATSSLQLTFTDPGLTKAKQPTLYFHGALVGSDKATFALLSLLSKS